MQLPTANYNNEQSHTNNEESNELTNQVNHSEVEANERLPAVQTESNHNENETENEFSDFMWMAQENLEDFDKKVRDSSISLFGILNI